MDGQADEADILQAGGFTIQGDGSAMLDAELVSGTARGDLVMRIGVYIRIDAQGGTRDAATGAGDVVQTIEFLDALDIDLCDVVLDGGA